MAKRTLSEELKYARFNRELKRRLARKSHIEFMSYCWTHDRKSSPFLRGFHTTQICARIDQAIGDFRAGISTNLVISVHPRSGKTDIVSRYLGAHFLGEFPRESVIQATYSFDLSESAASDGRDIFRSAEYHELYPTMQISMETNQKAHWKIVDNTGKPTGGQLYASGLSSGLTGHGGALLILDDFFSGREEAESKRQRDRVWSTFTNDFLTRRAPVSIVIVLASQWNVDDVIGRIGKRMKEDQDFPRFEFLRFPARAKDYQGDGHYPNGQEFLFEERFGRKYYLEQYAILSRYESAALMDCNPKPREGSLLKVDGIVYEDIMPEDFKVRWARVWDVAHTAKQREGSDPDWTSGTKLAFEFRAGDQVPHLWVSHVARFRLGAVQRDIRIRTITEADGKYVMPAIEVSIDAKDVDDYMRANLPEFAWRSIKTSGDKVVRATPLEKIFETPGHVHVMRGAWNSEWLDEIMIFNGSGANHDDQVDNLTAGYILLVSQSAEIMSSETRARLAARRAN